MKKQIITLQGKGNTGKTNTLKLLIDKIKKDFSINLIFNKKDIIITATINGKKVGITTCGDTKSDLENDFDKMGDCDLYICASRTKGETVDFLNNQTKNGILVIHGKWYFYDKRNNLNEKKVRENLNMKQADVIYSQIIDMLT